MKRKLTAIFLTLCLLASLLPGALSAQAAGSNQFRVHYDMEGGCIFWSKGASMPVGNEEDFLGDGEATGNVLKTNNVNILIDTTRAADWDKWFSLGELYTHTPSVQEADRQLYVRVSYDTGSGIFQTLAVNAGCATPGFSFQNNVLSFSTPDAEGQVNVDIWWTYPDYEFYSFEPGDGQLAVDVRWNELGVPDWDGTNLLYSCVQLPQRRARLLLDDTATGLSFTWTEHLRCIRGDGLDGNGNWGDVWEPAGNSYTYPLTLLEQNGDPWRFYNVEFEFANDWNYLFAVNYDLDYGLVYYGVGSHIPWNEPDDFLPPQGMGNSFYPDNISFAQNGQPAAIHLRLEPSLSLNREAWDNGELNLWDSIYAEDRALTVIARYNDANGQWNETLLLDHDVLVSEAATWEDGLLTFTPPCGYGVDFDVYWTESEYAFETFRGTLAAPVVVQIEWDGDGMPELLEGISEDDRAAFRGRERVRVSYDVDSLSFIWEDEPPLRQICVEGQGENGSWEMGIVPEENYYCLDLDQLWDDGNPRTWYTIRFEFENFPMSNDGGLWINYNNGRGAAFLSMGYETMPECTADYYWHSGDDGRTWFSYDDEGYPDTIRLLLDETQAIDWGEWEQNWDVVFREADHVDDRGIYIYIRSNWCNGLVVANNCLTELGEMKGFFWQYHREDGVSQLFFGPYNESDVEINVYWSPEEWNFEAFQPTEDAPVMVEVDWWGSGTPILPEIDQNDIRVTDGRARMRVSEDTESLTFYWDETECVLRQINVEGLGDDGGWLNGVELGWDSCYTLELNQLGENGEPKNWYHIQFEFEGGAGNDSTLRVFYDTYKGSVFRAFDGETPLFDADYYQIEGDAGAVSLLDDYNDLRYVSLLLERGQALDWEAWENTGEISFYNNHEVDLMLYVKVKTATWQGYVVSMDELTATGENHGFSYDVDTGILSFFPESNSDMEIKVFWTGFDSEFDDFMPNGNNPVMVEIYWQDDGYIWWPEEAVWGNMIWGNDRGKLRVPLSTESLEFWWEDGDVLERVDMEGPYGEWLEDVWDGGGSFVLNLNQYEYGEKKTWYRVNFYFENSPNPDFLGWNGDAASYYDQSKGSVFYALGDETPTADAAHYLGTDWPNGFNFLSGGGEKSLNRDGNQTVHLLFDETKGLDWDAWNENGEIAFVDAWDLADRSLVVYYQSNDYEGVVLENDEVAELGQWLGFEWNAETHILSFLPPSDSDVILRVYWTEADAEFDAFQPTDDYPIMVECEWWNDGEILLPEDVGEVFQQEGRARIRVPEDTVELTFTWAQEYGVESIDVEGAGPDGDWLHLPVDQSEPHEYTLELNQSDENGNPRNWYHVNFNFFPNSDYQLWIDWARSEGNVFFGLGEAPALDEAHYVQDAPSYRTLDQNGDPVPGTVYLTLDPTHSVSYFSEEIEFWELPPYSYQPCIYVSYPHDDGTWFDEMVVYCGVVQSAGFSFENNTLSFTPENKEPVMISIYWNLDNLAYESFDTTEDKPVMVELWRGGGCPLDILDELPAEDVFTWNACEHIFTKVRVSADRESLRLTWPHEADVGMLEVEGAWEGGGNLILNPPPGCYYDLMLDQTEFGEPKTHYSVTAWAFTYEENPFTDVPESAYYRTIVTLFHEWGFVSGTTETTFSPNEGVTRAQMVTFLWRTMNCPTPETETNPFVDVQEDAYYYEAVLWAVENGVTYGVDATHFKPWDVCTRGQVITFLFRLRALFHGEWEADPLPDCPFNDVRTDAYYYLPVLWAAELGVTVGTTETTFSPNRPCTRAQALVLLYRTLAYE